MIKLKELLKENNTDVDDIEGMKSAKEIGHTKSIGELDDFTVSYIGTALCSSTDNSTPSGGRPLDDNYKFDDIDPQTLNKMKKDCEDFQSKYRQLYEKLGMNDDEAGHNFWLSRNGHGAGFFDVKDWKNPDAKKLGDALQKVAKSYGTFDLYVGDGPNDGIIFGG